MTLNSSTPVVYSDDKRDSRAFVSQQVTSITRVVKRVVNLNGKEHIIEEVVDEPDMNTSQTVLRTLPKSEDIAYSGKVHKIVRRYVDADGNEKFVEEEVGDLDGGAVLSRLANTIPSYLRKVPGDDGTNQDGIEGRHRDATVSYVITEETVPSDVTGGKVKRRKVEKIVKSEDGQETIEVHEDAPVPLSQDSSSPQWLRRVTRIEVGQDGRQQITEEIEESSVTNEKDAGPAASGNTRKTIYRIISPDGKEHVTEKTVEDPQLGTVIGTLVTPVSIRKLKGQENVDLLTSTQNFIDCERIAQRVSPKSSASTPDATTTFVTRIVRVIRKVIQPNGTEVVSEDIYEEPVEIPKGERVEKCRRDKVITIVVDPSGKEHITELYIDEPETPLMISSTSSPDALSADYPKKKTSIATSPLSPEPLEVGLYGPLKTVEVSLSLQEKSGQIGPAPQIQSSVKLERSLGRPPLELTKQWSTVDIPSTEYSELVVPAAEIESLKDELSISSSLVESTDIAVPDDSVSSVDTPRPTEDILRNEETSAMSELDSITRSLEHGYEPDDISTLDEIPSLGEMPRKGKKKTKKRQKLPVHWSDSETNVPRSSYDSPSVSVSDVGPKVAMKTASENQVTSPVSSAHTIPSSPDDLVRIVEENIVTRPSSETGSIVSGQVSTIVPIYERIPTREDSVQTTPDPVRNVDEVVTRSRQPTQEESIQTSPNKLEDNHEESTQTVSPEVPVLLSAHVQTIRQETRDDSIQTLSPVPSVSKPMTTDLSMQTDSAKLSEQSMQTSKPSSPEEMRAQSGDASVQTPRTCTDNQSVQAKDAQPSSDCSVQTFIPTNEMCQQTSPPDKPERNVVVSSTAIQTSPIPISSDNERSSSSSSDQPLEVTVKTSFTFGQEGTRAHDTTTNLPAVHTKISFGPDGNAFTNVDCNVDVDAKTITKKFIEAERPAQNEEQTCRLPEPNNAEASSLTIASDRLGDKLRRLKAGTHHSTRGPNVLYLASLQVNSPINPHDEEKNVTKLKNQLKSVLLTGNYQQVQGLTVEIIEHITSWIEAIEYRTMVLRENHIKEGPDSNRIQELTELRAMAQRAQCGVQDLESSVKPYNDNEIFSPCLKSLLEQAVVVENLVTETVKQQEEDFARWEEFSNAVCLISTMVEDTRAKLDDLQSSVMPSKEQANAIDQIEIANRAHMLKVSYLLNNAHGLLRDFPGHELPNEIYSIQDNVRHITRDISESRERLEQRISLAAEYEATLKELEQITDVAEALVSAPIAVKDLQHLQDEVGKSSMF